MFVSVGLKDRSLCLPVDSLHHDEDFLPGTVRSWLPVYNGISQQLLQALHVYDTESEHIS